MGKQKRGGKREIRDDFDADRINGSRKLSKSGRMSKEQRAIETEIDMQEVPPNKEDIIALIKEGNDFYGDCSCGIPLSIQKSLTDKGEMDYSFSCGKCGKKWTIQDLING